MSAPSSQGRPAARTRSEAWLTVIALLAAAFAGCVSEAPRVDEPPAKEAPRRAKATIVRIAAPRLGEDAESVRRLEQAVGLASGVEGISALVLGGDVVTNTDARLTPDALETFGSLVGIVAAKRFVALGPREREGALPQEDVTRALERKKVLPSRSGTYADAIGEDVRLVVIDAGPGGEVSRDTEKAALALLSGAKERAIIIAGDRPPIHRAIEDAIRADRRVKAVLFRDAGGRVEAREGEPLRVGTPPLEGEAAAIHIIDLDGPTIRVRLLRAATGSVISEQSERTRE